jgi:hypothetical protein
MTILPRSTARPTARSCGDLYIETCGSNPAKILILDLPFEVLFLILSNVLPIPSPIIVNPLDIRFSPFHAVRSTCTGFRQIAYQFPFRYKDNFDVRVVTNSYPGARFRDVRDFVEMLLD